MSPNGSGPPFAQHGHEEIGETLQNLNAFCAQLATIS